LHYLEILELVQSNFAAGLPHIVDKFINGGPFLSIIDNFRGSLSLGSSASINVRAHIEAQQLLENGVYLRILSVVVVGVDEGNHLI
jgi:hypothetical protein